MEKKKPVWIVYELVKKKVSFINFLMMHFLFKTDFLLTISIQYQADKWWEKRKISVRGL